MDHTRISGRRRRVAKWFAALAAVLIPLGAVFVGMANSAVGNNALHGYNVQTVALQVSTEQLAPTQPGIGVPSATNQANERALASKFGG
jgi:hypothetical protein